MSHPDLHVQKDFKRHMCPVELSFISLTQSQLWNFNFALKAFYITTPHYTYKLHQQEKLFAILPNYLESS